MNPEISNMRDKFIKLYGDNKKEIEFQIKRYSKLFEYFKEKFNEIDVQFFSTPGRTEIGGNHTDHNAGIILAGSVNLDSIAVAAKTNNDVITIYSKGFPKQFVVNINDVQPYKSEEGTTTGLIRGIVSRFKDLNFLVGGFNAFITSNVLVGSGLSSSASIEVLIGTILNTFYNKARISAEDIAFIGQYAENKFFNKPCGLMDQMTCSVGGIISIDFKNLQKPKVRKVNFDFSTQNYNLLVVDTGGSHADLTDDYASIPLEMKKVAKILGATVAREITREQVYDNINLLRQKVGDRAILRILHFLADNQRVLEQVNALENGDFENFLNLINDSGNSSNKWLQNSYSNINPAEQGVNLALALSEDYIKKIGTGACRVHGGGFAGTIQVFLPVEYTEKYKKMMQRVFGKSSVFVVKIRSYGSLHLDSMM
jgi:galactokinase